MPSCCSSSPSGGGGVDRNLQLGVKVKDLNLIEQEELAILLYIIISSPHPALGPHKCHQLPGQANDGHVFWRSLTHTLTISHRCVPQEPRGCAACAGSAEAHHPLNLLLPSPSRGNHRCNHHDRSAALCTVEGGSVRICCERVRTQRSCMYDLRGVSDVRVDVRADGGLQLSTALQPSLIV